MGSGDWLRPDWLTETLRAWGPSVSQSMTQAMRPVVDLFGFAPASLAEELILAAASRLVGEPLTLQVGDTEIALVLRRLQPDPQPLGLMIGQLGDVEIDADDVVAGDVRIAHLHLVVRNLHVQPGVGVATFVAAPIAVRATLDQEVVATAVARRTPHVEVELGDGPFARARLRGRPDWGHVDLTPRIEGRTLVLEPREATLRRWDVTSVARRLPPIRLALPPAAATAHLTDVGIEDGHLVVDGTYEEWRTEVGPVELEDLRRRLKAYDGGTLRVPSQDELST
ncbi:MAG TPA: hypothetical protein VF228_09325 [Iamia sp.]